MADFFLTIYVDFGFPFGNFFVKWRCNFDSLQTKKKPLVFFK